MIDDHLMPSGEPAPLPTRRDRNLESLGGSTRLELGLGGVMRVLRRRGILLLGIFVRRVRADLRGEQPASEALLVGGLDQDQRRVTGDLHRRREVGRPHEGAARGHPQPAITASSARTSQDKLGAKFNDVKSVTSTGLEASPLIRIDSSASSPRIAERAANAASEYAVTEREALARAKLLADADSDDATAQQLSDSVDELSTELVSVPPTEREVRRAEGEARCPDGGAHRGREEGFAGAIERGDRRRWARDLRDRAPAARTRTFRSRRAGPFSADSRSC